MKNLLLAALLLAVGPVLAQTPAQNLASSPAARRDVGNLTVENVPELPVELLARVAQYQNVRGAAVADWDGAGLLVSTRFGEVPQLCAVAAPGAERKQLTNGKEPLTAAAVCPDRRQHGFIYSADAGGNENFQLYYQDLDKNLGTGSARRLTDGRSRNLFQGWNRAGTQLAYLSNQRNGADLDLFIVDFPAKTAPTPAPTLELKGGGWRVAAWADDGRQLILANYKSVNESELYRLDMSSPGSPGSRQLQRLHPTAAPVAYAEVEFSADGRGLFLISDEGSEFQTLRYLDLKSGQLAPLAPGIGWDITALERSRDGRRLVFAANEGGYSKLYVLDAQTREFRPVPGVPAGVIGGFRLHDDGRRLALTLSSARSSADAYVLDLATGTLARWTTSETGGLDPATFVEPTLVQYPTFDQAGGKPRLIPAFVYRPRPAKAGGGAAGKVPVVISIHGGPEGQSLPNFSALNNMLVNELGVAVLVPNVRGSTGYGKTYVALDNGPRREDAVRDIGALLDWIATQPDLDPTRVAVFGGSYGGYMSLATMTNYNARMRCGVDLFGISNFVTFLQNTSAYRADLRRAEYGDERDPAMRAAFETISPIRKIKNITRPMLVYQGQNDPRVPRSESEQMVAGLRQQGTPVWYVLAKDEGHSLAKKANRDFTYGAMMLFLRDNLGPAAGQ